MTQYITFLRHAEVENKKEIIYGALEGYFLSAIGVKNTKKKANDLKNNPYQLIISSPLERTKQTAQIVKKEALPQIEIEYTKEIIEWVYITQGMSRRVWNSGKYAKLKAIYDQDPYQLPVEVEGQKFESFVQMQSRMQKFIKQTLAKNLSHVLVVSHGDPIIVAICSTLGISYHDFKQKNKVDNLSTNTLVFENKKFKELRDLP